MTDDGNAPTLPDTSSPGPSSGPPRPPDSRYVLRRLLGRGGMGEVWLAHDTRVDRELAVKLLRGGAASGSDAVARFLREARVQSRLEHPGVVPVHDLGEDPNAPFFAMKRLSGVTLADVLARGDGTAWPLRTLLARFVDVCLAVEYAHQRGVIHRDLKPANIMLGDFGEAYVLDWGLARVAEVAEPTPEAQHHSHRSAASSRDSQGGQTEAGALLGTPGYMAPEQARGEVVDHLADVYALGLILYEILTGMPAIARARFEDTLEAPHHRPSVRVPSIPPELDEACVRATAAERTARVGSARALAEDVQRYLDGDRDLERRRELAAAHVRRAQELVAQSTEAANAEAMREAGSAIALDAGNRDAHAVLARLLLEPPAETPPGVHARIEDERQQVAHKLLGSGALVYIAFFMLLPIANVLGIAGDAAFIAIGTPIIALFATCAIAWWRRAKLTPLLAVWVLALHSALVAIVGVVFGPLLILPTLLFGSLPVMLLVPTVRMPLTVVVLHLLAFAVPVAGEWLGWLRSTHRFVDGALVLDPWAIDVTPQGLLVVLGFVVIAQLIGNTMILQVQRNNQERAQLQVHVHAWRLRQLVRNAEPAA